MLALDTQIVSERGNKRHRAAANRRIHGFAVSVQLIPDQRQRFNVIRTVMRDWLPLLKRPRNFLQYGLLGCLLAVQFQYSIAQMALVQPPLDDLKGGHFLCHEQNGLSAAQQFRNDVSDGLRFPGAGRTLDN